MRTPLSNQKTPIPAREWARWWGRRLSAPARARPDFLIIGAQKGGTTSLYQYLARHPQVAWAVPVSLGDSHRGFSVLGTQKAYFERFRYGHDRPLQVR